jgi:hypothetical protein
MSAGGAELTCLDRSNSNAPVGYCLQNAGLVLVGGEAGLMRWHGTMA